MYQPSVYWNAALFFLWAYLGKPRYLETTAALHPQRLGRHIFEGGGGDIVIQGDDIVSMIPIHESFESEAREREREF